MTVMMLMMQIVTGAVVGNDADDVNSNGCCCR
jgi:hypothetical protein